MRLSSKVIIKDFSENNCFILDLEDENNAYLKCVDVFAELTQYSYKQENFTSKSLFDFLKSKYPDVEDSVLNRDVSSFINFLTEKKFLAE